MQQVPTGGEAPKAEGRTSWEQAAWLRRQQAVASKQASHINRKGKAFRRHQEEDQEGAAELGSVPNVGGPRPGNLAQMLPGRSKEGER